MCSMKLKERYVKFVALGQKQRRTILKVLSIGKTQHTMVGTHHKGNAQPRVA